MPRGLSSPSGRSLASTRRPRLLVLRPPLAGLGSQRGTSPIRPIARTDQAARRIRPTLPPKVYTPPRPKSKARRVAPPGFLLFDGHPPDYEWVLNAAIPPPWTVCTWAGFAAHERIDAVVNELDQVCVTTVGETIAWETNVAVPPLFVTGTVPETTTGTLNVIVSTEEVMLGVTTAAGTCVCWPRPSLRRLGR